MNSSMHSRKKVTNWNKKNIAILADWDFVPFIFYFFIMPIVEFVSFSLVENATREIYMEKYSRVYESFLKNHPEFINFKHLYDPSTWIYANYVEWKSMEWAERASKEIFDNTDAQDWFSLMKPESINMYHFESIN